jgi:hypothetical protein
MKRIGLRLAGALFALSTCVGSSLNAKVPVSYAAPAGQQGAPDLISCRVVVVVIVVRNPQVSSLEHVDAAKQFDATR